MIFVGYIYFEGGVSHADITRSNKFSHEWKRMFSALLMEWWNELEQLFVCFAGGLRECGGTQADVCV